MLGKIQIFNWKSKQAQAEEDAAYERWAFPYGAAQREKLQKLLLEVFPKETVATTLIPFLTCKEIFENARRELDTDELAARRLIGEIKKYKRVIRKNEMHLYVALVLADKASGETSEYPGAGEIRERAEALALDAEQAARNA
ncbi:MAG: hypothetical protein LBD49_03260 [Oscillospiraceae bacterium]|jgi:hypothetical protein|nr:hypothetical protein [Oscillospiraceae bacterium]